MSINKNEIKYEDNFLKEKESLIEKYGHFFSLDFEKSISRIQEFPIPPQTPLWHTLKEYCTDEMIVGARAIPNPSSDYEPNYDRIVYEYIPSKRLIIFTNCIDHRYRDNQYSNTELEDIRYFNEVFLKPQW